MKTFEKFEALSSKKKKCIINAAMEEFIHGGYEKSSMNTIVERAGISKGSLFYYFDNKKKLYLYLFEICEEMILETAAGGIDESDRDFISRMSRSIKANIDLLRNYPLAYGFMRSCKSEQSITVKDDIAELSAKNASVLFAKVYKDIDKTLFKSNIDVEMSIYTIKSTLFQIVHDGLLSNNIETEDVKNKIDAYANFFREALYKKETGQCI